MSTHKTQGRPYELDGSFHVDPKSREGDNPHGRRLMFRTTDGYVGFSHKFKRSEAFHNALAKRANSAFRNSNPSQS